MISRIAVVFCWTISAVAASAVAAGQSGPEPVSTPPADAGPHTPAVTPGEEPEREQLRQAFVDARGNFARVTAEALTSEELNRWIRGLSQRVRLRRTQEDLFEVRSALDSLAQSGKSDTERAQRLAEREAELSREVGQLTSPDGAAAPGGIAMPDQATVRNWIEREMADETNHLADTLTDRELARRTRRMQRLARLATFARRFQEQRRFPSSAADGDGGIVPAGGVKPSADSVKNADFDELGSPTRVPPALPESSLGESEDSPPELSPKEKKGDANARDAAASPAETAPKN